MRVWPGLGAQMRLTQCFSAGDPVAQCWCLQMFCLQWSARNHNCRLKWWTETEEEPLELAWVLGYMLLWSPKLLQFGWMPDPQYCWNQNPVHLWTRYLSKSIALAIPTAVTIFASRISDFESDFQEWKSGNKLTRHLAKKLRLIPTSTQIASTGQRRAIQE